MTRALAVATGLVLAAAQAAAIGTDAGTAVSNTATVDYTVGTVNQPDVNSNAANFVVDRRVLLTVAEVSNVYTDVTPGDIRQVLTFTVTNDTNATLDFQLDASQDTTGTTEAHGGTDDFDATAVQVFVDSNANGTYDFGVDAVAFADEIAEGGQATVFIVATIPFGEANGNTAGLTLTATAAEPGGVGLLGLPVAQTSGADTAGSVDTVFGDVAGDTDAARDGKHSDDDAYRVVTATLAVTKISTVISDPFNGTSNPKRIPGAVVEYCVTVQNNGAAPATSVVLTDVLTTQPVTYQGGSIFTEDGTTCAGGTAEDDDASGADEAPNGGSESSGTVSATFSSIAAGAGKAMRFRVTID